MRIGPFEFRIIKAGAGIAETLPQGRARVPPDSWSTVTEANPGDWQRGITQPDPSAEVLKFGAVFAAVTLIADDIAKLQPQLQVLGTDGVWRVSSEGPAAALLRKPNRYQTWQQFLTAWMVSRLMHGNAYVFKRRAPSGSVEALHVLEPETVKVMLTTDGGVYYGTSRDTLAQITEATWVYLSEIAHDRGIAPFHPLIGLSTVAAAAVSGTFGRRIQQQSMQFFANASRPSGTLTSDHEIGDETAERLKRDFEQNFAGLRFGRLLVAGSGLKYEPMTMPAHDAQLIEQLQWTGSDICRIFKIPAYRLGCGPMPSLNNIAQLTQDYYGQVLLPPITAIETLLTEALELPARQRVALDTSPLLRMDAASRAETAAKLVNAGILAPNEARASENLPPVRGGEVPFMQQQMWQIGQLAGRTPPADAPAKTFDVGVGVGPSSSAALGQ